MIEIITSTPLEAQELFSMNRAYHTQYAWQMHRKVTKEELNIKFQRVRLPREMLVQPALTSEEQLEINLTADIVMIAQKNQNHAGFVALKEHSSTGVVEIVDLVVRQNYRREKIGSKLVYTAQDWASHQGCQRLLARVTTKNDPAIQLLESNGFAYCGFQEFLLSRRDIYLHYGLFLR